MLIRAHFFQQAISTPNVGQSDLVFGMWSGFVSRSVQARLQVSVCSSYDLFHPGQWSTSRQTHTLRDRQHLTSLFGKLASQAKDKHNAKCAINHILVQRHLNMNAQYVNTNHCVLISTSRSLNLPPVQTPSGPTTMIPLPFCLHIISLKHI